MSDLRVKCVVKHAGSNDYETIQSLGGTTEYGIYNWKKTKAEVIRDIETRTNSFYVERPAGDRVKVVIAVTGNGTKYLKTEADGDKPNNLLSLPPCS